MPKQRLDQLLVERQLAPSREQAQRRIRAGQVLVDDRVIDKPGAAIARGAAVRLRLPESRFASRGGEKLQAALQTFSIDVQSKSAADLGASNGGFTDCLLQRGARRVYAIDVGRGQLAYFLQQDPRVVVMDHTNCRYLQLEDLGEPVSLITADLSFISLRTVFPAMRRIIEPAGEMALLLKPQFEIGKGRVGKGGLVREKADHLDVLSELRNFFSEQGWPMSGLMPSPIQGKSGNIEFLAYLQPESASLDLNQNEIVHIVENAHRQFGQ